MKALILILLASAFASPILAEDVQYDIRVDGITCPFCVATSERALKKIEGVHTVGANLETGVIFVCADSQVNFTNAQLKQLFLDKGFTYRSFEKTPGCSIADHADTND
ncbi:MAG: heavy-metal-associated domain-containing protein [Proteobacteria bacterium]|nr:heavy-metal-associated domain-containing protein [Pseudomonadota bacterium]